MGREWAVEFNPYTSLPLDKIMTSGLCPRFGGAIKLGRLQG